MSKSQIDIVSQPNNSQSLSQLVSSRLESLQQNPSLSEIKKVIDLFLERYSAIEGLKQEFNRVFSSKENLDGEQFKDVQRHKSPSIPKSKRRSRHEISQVKSFNSSQIPFPADEAPRERQS